MRRERSQIKSFFALYGLMLGDYSKSTVAYEAAEMKWMEVNDGRRFYKNYNSFNRCRNFLKKNYTLRGVR